MKNRLKNFLIRNKLYFPLRYSWPFDIYQRIFKPGDVEAHRKEVAFYRSFLPDCDLIFDIGANDGHKTEAFLEIADRVVCCEPDAHNTELLRTRFRHHRDSVTLIQAAVSESEGTADLLVHHPGSAFNTLSTKWKKLLEADQGRTWKESIQFTGTTSVQTTTLDRLIAEFGRPDFIKIDTEGHERSVLQGLSVPVPCLSFEMLLPGYADELDWCLNHLGRLAPDAKFNIAEYERLVLPTFLPLDEFKKWLAGTNTILSFEVIVKMPA